MKKVALVARQNIVNPMTGRVHDDTGLRALDGIRYGKMRVVEDHFDSHEVMKNLIQEFEADNGDFCNCWYALTTKDV